MSNPSPFNTLLVPTDFSAASLAAFNWSINCVDGDDPLVIVLHVLDSTIVDAITAHNFATHETVTQRLRKQAQEQLTDYGKTETVEVDSMIAEGVPFVEIIRKADDFAVDAIVMGRVGAQGKIEHFLFGSTAEKVIRGARRPVVVLPGS
jgi:nucleotide-binding universal stress UspA family protein